MLVVFGFLNAMKMEIELSCLQGTNQMQKSDNDPIPFPNEA